VTVFEEHTTEEQRSVVLYLWEKGLNTKDIYKEMLSVYGGIWLPRKLRRGILSRTFENRR
jgi:hypothetical protein